MCFAIGHFLSLISRRGAVMRLTAAGVFMTAMALLAAAPSVRAADWSFYGSSRFGTFYDFWKYSDASDPDSDEDFRWFGQDNSRLGGRVQSGALSGRFEYGADVNLRILWAEYDWGGTTLGFGQNYTPVHNWVSGQVYADDANLQDMGALYGGRRDMIRLKTHGMELAFIEPSTASHDTGGEVDQVLPKIEIRYDLPMGGSRLGVMAGYNAYTVESPDQKESVDINTWAVGLEGQFNFGNTYISTDVFRAQNYNDYGFPSYFGQGQAAGVVVEDWSTEESSSTGSAMAIGFATNNMFTFEFGGGYIVHDNKQEGSKEDSAAAFYIQANLNSTKGFFIVPEAGYYAFWNDNREGDKERLVYLGAKWQINF